MIRIEIDGILRITDSADRDLTPRGLKTRGLVALLAVADNYRRSRSYLQDKLWSTRQPEQGSASLRQSLSELRRALGPCKTVLRCDRGIVEFVPDAVEIVRSPAPKTTAFEDLDIRDPEFENWLRDIRVQLRHSANATAPGLLAPATSPAVKPGVRTPLIVFRSTRELGVADNWVYQRFRESVITSVRELGDVDFIDMSDPIQQLSVNHTPLFFISVEIAAGQETSLLSIRIETPVGRILWRSRIAEIDNPPDDETSFNIGCLANNTCQALGECLNDKRQTYAFGHLPVALACRGRAQIFDFSRHALIEADRLLAAAYALEPKPVYLAWRAFVRNTAAFEHLSNDFLEPLNNEEIISGALREDPENSLVLAFAAQHSLVHQKDFGFGELLCEKAIESNEANALSWAFRANLLTAQKRFDDALVSAEKAVSLASGRALKNFTSIFSCMARIGKGDYAGAASNAQFARALSPDFIAIRRFLFALYQATARLEQANSVRQEILVREPDFDTATLFSPHYPVGTLRSTDIMALL